MPITAIEADLTTLAVDVIVNAANETLLGGGGVDGAIHRAAGPRLLAACRALPEVRPSVRCPTGEARLTPGFDLPARWVIHTVGPVWHGGTHGEPALLAACYRHAMEIAAAQQLRRMAFPAISCGVFGYPAELAAGVAVASLRAALTAHGDLDVTLCCYSAPMQRIVAAALRAGNAAI
ncbi:MAG: O-acetyl-ADP-ribose deacetylase [Rhodanobacter sp.]|nr:MAG: O-acetyl-ADP-ribose deacetylase [Rhodanobacter sp.]TAM15089.1 MAG: O-acetyl-ADP-ribose deacetylase [Rhodanobacter sp.]TAM36441.1 MAG: O-acetyl-ADP-ribose deacetylase [Rhodanobacter sp.]